VPALSGREEKIAQIAAPYERALAMRTELLAETPTPDARRDLAISHLYLLTLARLRGDDDAACAALAAGWPHAREYARVDTPDARGVRWLYEQLLGAFDCAAPET